MTEQTDKPELNNEQEKALRIASLISGYIHHRISPEELNELDEWVGESDENMALFEDLTNEKVTGEALDWMNAVDTKEKLQEIRQKLEFNPESTTRTRVISIIKKFAVAAILIVAAGSIVWWVSKQKNTTTPSHPIASTEKADLQPGREQAILTVENGKTIVLDQANDGKLLTEGNTSVTKENGQLLYNSDGSSNGKKDIYHTLSTPRGGIYPLTLSDGTKVWLNASSSINFPAEFTGNDRIVTISGEAYFEVAPKSRPSITKPGTTEKIPFFVQLKDKDIKVEVLGTHFNINTYEDEPITKTTLLEGKVKITAGGKSSFLKPNQQAQVNSLNQINMVTDADVMKAVAWKEGMFRFSGEDLKTIMRQVSRWYDVDIQYDKAVNNTGYHFILPRNIPVSKLFEVLEETGGAHFVIEGRTIKVLPQK